MILNIEFLRFLKEASVYLISRQQDVLYSQKSTIYPGKIYERLKLVLEDQAGRAKLELISGRFDEFFTALG